MWASREQEQQALADYTKPIPRAAVRTKSPFPAWRGVTLSIWRRQGKACRINALTVEDEPPARFRNVLSRGQRLAQLPFHHLAVGIAFAHHEKVARSPGPTARAPARLTIAREGVHGLVGFSRTGQRLEEQ